MIIIHENLQREAQAASQALQSAYGLENQLVDVSLEGEFPPLPEFEGYWVSQLTNLRGLFGDKPLLVITPRDLYQLDASKDDDWILGYNAGNTSVVSTARIKRKDNQPGAKIEVPDEVYLKRLSILAVHEIGHDVVKAPYFQPAVWVNSQTGHQLPLGPHCDDNSCSMYEIVDIKTPPASEGHMLLGTEKKFDAGLDDLLARLNPRWFCDRCVSSIKIS
ncbi:MAG: hypothetical protein AABX00_06025 [Nanoarchaeota archaeon]